MLTVWRGGALGRVSSAVSRTATRMRSAIASAACSLVSRGQDHHEFPRAVAGNKRAVETRDDVVDRPLKSNCRHSSPD